MGHFTRTGRNHTDDEMIHVSPDDLLHLAFRTARRRGVEHDRAVLVSEACRARLVRCAVRSDDGAGRKR